MKISILSFTLKGDKLGEKLTQELVTAGHKVLHTPSSVQAGVHAWTKANFSIQDALIYIGAVGIAVRALAPHLVSKTSDPAVLVLDQEGRYAIPLLSGHIGGANQLALELETLLGLTPVITTATDLENIFSVDSWATKTNLAIVNPKGIVYISSALLKGLPVYLNTPFSIKGTLPLGVVIGTGEAEILVDIYSNEKPLTLQLTPKVLTLGVGCRQGVSLEQVENLFFLLLKKHGLLKEAFSEMCSIELKATEPALLAFSERQRLPFKTYTTQELIEVKGSISSSPFVEKTVGVDNVCERSALFGHRKKLLVPKETCNGVTMAVALETDYEIIFRSDHE